jgi:uncharacterized protein
VKDLFIYLLLITVSALQPLHAQSIFDLARSGSVKEMQTYLKKHPEQLNLISEHGASPFLLAAYRGNNEVAQLLLDKGADVHYCYAEGSAIYALIYKNNLALIEELLKRGVNPNDTCQFEQLGYPLHLALSLQRYDALALLLENKASLEVKDPQGRSIAQLLQLYNDPKFNQIIKKYEK